MESQQLTVDMTKPILNIADVVIQTADPARTPKADTAKYCDRRWGEVSLP